MRHATIAAGVLLVLAMAQPASADRRDHLSEVGPAALTSAQEDSIRFSLRILDNNLWHATITNYGFLGNNFVSRSPSLEYPFGTGFEHMVRGGLWIGGEAIDDQGPFIGVTTGALDGGQGSSGQGATEFTPAGLEILIRSTLPNSRYFNGQAVSELDFLSTFDDKTIRRSANNNEVHRSMNLLIRQENYSWSFSDFQHFFVLHFVIKNTGPPLKNLWVGFYSEFASGPKERYSNWPPSSSGSALGSWFGKKLLGYEADQRLFREHFCQNIPAPEACQFEVVPYWVGKSLLGWKTTPADAATPKKITLAAWNWAPGDAARDTDEERFAILSAGTVQNVTADSLKPGVGDPVGVLAVGPFSQLDPGDSIAVDFAIVGGADVEAIRKHNSFAIQAFERDFVVPVPPPSPRFLAVAHNEALDLYWDDSPENAEDPTSSLLKDFEGYRVYLGQDRLAMRRVAQFDKVVPPHDTTGFNTGLTAVRLAPPAVIDGSTYHYKYTVPSLRNGFKYFAAVTSYDLGSNEIESLESGVTQNLTSAIPSPGPGERVAGDKVTVFPNPYRVEASWDQGRLVRDHYLWFSNLPERCTIKIYTLAGDIVFDVDFDGMDYRGETARGVFDTRSEDPPSLSGRSFAWNLITREGQAAATGLYLYSVEDRASGDRTLGKFLIVKSDREEF